MIISMNQYEQAACRAAYCGAFMQLQIEYWRTFDALLTHF
jgi:hypothetical protein